YMPSLYYAEDHFSAHIKRIMQTEIENETTEAELLKIIGQIEEEESIYYGEQQFEAMRDALHEKVMILTGGPGRSEERRVGKECRWRWERSHERERGKAWDAIKTADQREK